MLIILSIILNIKLIFISIPYSNLNLKLNYFYGYISKYKFVSMYQNALKKKRLP